MKTATIFSVASCTTKKLVRDLILTAWMICFICLATSTTLANDPGGGTNGVGANVTVSLSGATATLANGVITATIDTTSGTVTSYLFNGTQMLDTSGHIYYSMDGGTSYENPGSCVYSVTTSNSSMVDISCKVTWASHTNRVHAFDIDCHYVLRRGDTGLYAYAILAHPASYPDTGVGEWRIVWKLPHSSTDWTFERIYVDALRNWYWGTYSDFVNEASTGIAEIKTLTSGARAGLMDCKYEYAAEYQKIGCWGHASDTNKIGVWFVLGGYDYLNDGPNMTDLTVAESYLLQHFGRDHFGGSGTSVAAGESWSKIFGPFLLYCNKSTATTHQGDALWADAQAQMQAEVGAWPYSWLTNSDYPADSARGTVTGKIILTDSLKPALAAGTNTWVGVAQPDPGGNWQFDSKHYQSWVHPDANGSFSIAHIRPGTYTLSAWTVGAVGEYTLTNVLISAGATNALGNLNWTNTHPGGQIAWEIGIPDRSAAEFKHGTNYWYPFLWTTYTNDFPNPLTYNVGTSNWTNNWNYAQPGYLTGTNTWSQWKWRINFTLTNLPPSGSATITFAIASLYYGAIDVYVNDESTLTGEVAVNIAGGGAGGNALIREGIHAKYGLGYQSVPLSALRLGTNTITLIQRSINSGFNHVMYDYVNLELPAGPPAPPPGRNLLWRGGNTANAWDIATTTNWVISSNSVATTFTNGDNVTFDDTGTNFPAVTKSGSMLPGFVTVQGKKTWTLGGSGTLDGTMALYKAGTNLLILNGTNNFAGGTIIDDGVIQLGSGELSNAGIGGGPITFAGGTLQLNGYGIRDNGSTYYGTLPNNLIVPVGQVGTILCPQRIAGNGVLGQLTGGGTLNFTVDYVRGLLSGDWSAFTGQINVLNRTGSGDFRVKNATGFGNAAVNLAAGVNLYCQAGGKPVVDIGELSGSAGALLSTTAGNSGGQPVIWRVGRRNTSAVFAGNVTEQTGIIKTGSGIWTLSGASTHSGLTAVAGGTLQITGSITTTNFIIVSNAATLDLPGTVIANTVQIYAGGTLTGCGAIFGNLLNNGTVLSDCGATLEITGSVTNNGTMQFVNGSGLAVTGTLVNNHLLDLLTGVQTLPAGFINNGTVLLATNLVVTSAVKTGGTFTLLIQGYDGHTYQLQRSATLPGPNWQSVGPSQDGAGAPLTFTDTPGGSQNFYRVMVSP